MQRFTKIKAPACLTAQAYTYNCWCSSLFPSNTHARLTQALSAVASWSLHLVFIVSTAYGLVWHSADAPCMISCRLFYGDSSLVFVLALRIHCGAKAENGCDYDQAKSCPVYVRPHVLMRTAGCRGSAHWCVSCPDFAASAVHMGEGCSSCIQPSKSLSKAHINTQRYQRRLQSTDIPID